MRIGLRDAETKGMNDALKRQLDENVPVLRSLKVPEFCEGSVKLSCKSDSALLLCYSWLELIFELSFHAKGLGLTDV